MTLFLLRWLRGNLELVYSRSEDKDGKRFWYVTFKEKL